ncbi:MAG: pirin family protein [Leptospirillia bacterium]
MDYKRLRRVSTLLEAHRTVEGAGLPVNRSFPQHGRMDLDPFMLFDHFGPVTWGPKEASGVPDHPHRGFETVTYVLEGALEHRDSTGGGAVLRAGDVQWMTAGSGIVHSEMPEADFFNNGGTLHGFQIWVNLPAKDKMVTPRYQDVPADQTPIAHSDDGKATVRVVAGESLGVKGAVETRIPITYLHVTLAPGGELLQPVTSGHNAGVYVFGGEALVAGDPVGEGGMAVLGEGDAVTLSVPEGAVGPADLLLLAGAPIDEPVARYGPFVMNTHEEIRQAVRDYEAGRMGRIAP